MLREDENVLVAQAAARVFPPAEVINTVGTFASKSRNRLLGLSLSREGHGQKFGDHSELQMGSEPVGWLVRSLWLTR